ncbi:CIA30 family protein [Synechococcus sp. RSCCF101]|uniref:CIA30 family protein n=1 Tax=Synechococcus sp. RSCCF101 TaxID=2511069 RepID=UPI003519ECCD
MPPPLPAGALEIATGAAFSGWLALNDTVMGGRSSAACSLTPEGLLLAGEVIEAGGGFVSCRSPLFSPPLDLSAYRALRLQLRGDGRTYKLAVATRDGALGLTELIPSGLRWVAEVPTQAEGRTVVEVPFAALTPSIRARPVGFSPRFDQAGLTRLQLLHSRFGTRGDDNPGFRAGPIRLLLEAIHAVP